MAECIIVNPIIYGEQEKAYDFTNDGYVKITYSSNVVIPSNVTKLNSGTSTFGFYNHSEIETITFETPANVQSIASSTFSGCTGLKHFDFPVGSSVVSTNLFYNCTSLQEVVIPHGVVRIQEYAFQNCTSLRTLRLPNTITEFWYRCLTGCSALSNIVLETGWNTEATFSLATALTESSMVNMFNSLKDLTDTSSKTLTLGSENLAKLTEEDKAIATAKNWTLA